MPQIERFAVGSIECHILPDGGTRLPAADLNADMTVNQIKAELPAGVVDEKDLMEVPFNCLLIRSGGRIALVDTGLGAEEASRLCWPAGRLMDSLTASGITADQVGLVIISHAHPDHIGGLTMAAGNDRVPVFARARHYFWQAEWDFWTSSEGLAQVPEEFADAARTHLPPLHRAELVERVSEETDVLPGVRLLPSPGHTPGHTVVALTSGGDSALYLGDAVLDEANFAHPDWKSRPGVEWNPSMAVAARTALIEKAIAENRLLIAFHLAARGYPERADGHYRLRHVGAQVPSSKIDSLGCISN
jgi:glyoxylase-like metal-dependent hydrolase (beta-lactamase superfamily II)